MNISFLTSFKTEIAILFSQSVELPFDLVLSFIEFFGNQAEISTKFKDITLEKKDFLFGPRCFRISFWTSIDLGYLLQLLNLCDQILNKGSALSCVFGCVREIRMIWQTIGIIVHLIEIKLSQFTGTKKLAWHPWFWLVWFYCLRVKWRR